jgi:hypothetical protein
MSFLKKCLKHIMIHIYNFTWFKFIYANLLDILQLDFFSTKRLSFAYDATILQDGMGAQIQRIISLKAISDELRCDFEPFEILNFDEAIFNDFDKIKKRAIIEKWENLLLIETYKNNRFRLTINFTSSRIFWLYLIRAISKLTFIPFRVKFAFPAPLIDKSNHIYEFCKNYFNQSAIKSTPNEFLNIVVHIRRGEVLLSQFRFRYLPFDYYEDILSAIIPILDENNVKYKATVLIEKITNPYLSNKSEKIVKSILDDANNPNLRLLENGDYLLVDDPLDKVKYPFLGSCNLKNNNDAFSDFTDMCESDILVISKSSFSFTAGLLNRKALKIFPTFWHSPPDSWVNADKISKDARIRITDLVSRKLSGNDEFD